VGLLGSPSFEIPRSVERDSRFDHLRTGEALRRSLAVVVGRAYSDVCVVASISTRDPECPAPVEDGTVWTQLAVPAAQ